MVSICQDIPWKILNNKSGFSLLKLITPVRCEDSQGRAFSRDTTADSRWSVFYNKALKKNGGCGSAIQLGGSAIGHTFPWVHVEELCSHNVWIRSSIRLLAVLCLIHVWSSYCGFPCCTSSAVTNTSGWGTPAFRRAWVAYFFVAEVQIAQPGCWESSWRSCYGYQWKKFLGK